MNFDLDDPLAGILSDGSDDSFFDDDILGEKKPTKKKETPIAQKKKDFFNIEEKTKLNKNTEEKNSTKEKIFGLDDDILKLDEPSLSSIANSVVANKDQKNKTTLEKDIPAIDKNLDNTLKYQVDEPNKLKTDLGRTLSFTKSPAKSKFSTSADKINSNKSEVKQDAGKSLQKGKSSQSLLDDILGGPSSKPTSSIRLSARPVTSSKTEEFDFDSLLRKSDAKTPTTPNKPTNITIQTKTGQTKSETVQKFEKTQPKKPNEDWLGVFKSKDEKVSEPEMPAWLGGGEDKKKKEVEPVPIARPKKEAKQEIEKLNERSTPMTASDEFENIKLDRNITVPTAEDAAATSAAMYLQQQESQLMVALQLKAQEEKLAAIQQRQEETARFQRESSKAHNEELDALLRRQTSQRQQMQAVIAAHQDRITERIKALLGTPKDTTDNIQTSQTHTDVVGENEDSHQIESGNPFKKEKRQLLQLIQSLQENHDKEIDLMETSYRRQLAFLEISLNQAEDRMKDDNDKLLKFYTDKITWIEEHHHLYKKLMAENFDSLSARHQEENEMLRHQHLDNIKVLQEHHANLMENIRNAVKQEQTLIQDSAGYSSNLMELVSDVKQSKSLCQQLIEKIQSISENNQKDAERNVQIRETHITDLMQQLKRERDLFETEKSESRETVKLLENRLKQMTSIMEDETANLKQKRMEFEFEKATFNKQTEFAKNVLKKQDDEIKSIREDIEKEYQEKITKINEEKAKVQKECVIVVKEKSTIQHIREELEIMKAELQMQLDEVSGDKSKINVERQRLHIEEQRISARKRDLEMLAKAAVEKQSQADKKYSEAEYTIRKYEERMRKMQEQVVSLNSREKQIAKEKVTLSRERIQLHNERKQMENSCSLCRSSKNVPQYQIQDRPQASKNVYNMDTAMNTLENEMASILSRNFALRNSLAVNTSGNVNNVATSMDRGAEHVPENSSYKDYMDPKFMMFRLDVQQVISNLDHNRSADAERVNTEDSAEDFSHHSDVDNNFAI